MRCDEIEAIELDLLLQALARRWGVDLQRYAPASLRRRVLHAARAAGVPRISVAIDRVLHEPAFFEAFLPHIFVSVTELFRDPEFFKTLREHVLPELATYPRPAIWHAGCATGEEVYSMAILLKEEGLLDRTRLVATDISRTALRAAQAGVYPLAGIMGRTEDYRRAGGRTALDDHLVVYNAGAARDGPGMPLCMMNPELRSRITWSHHNLCTERAFAAFNLVVCRNTLIYFDRELQEQVLSLFRASLVERGLLALGSKESLDLAACRVSFDVLSAQQQIYRKRRTGGAM